MGIDRGDIRLFALNASRGQGQRIADRLGVALAEHEEREFEGGEHKARSLVNVRGRDVFVIHSLQGEDGASANDKLCRLLFFIGALKDASAERVTAVAPYLCYARKDRKTRSRDPVATRYVAALFEAVGTDHVVTLDVHNLAAFQNAFRCRTDHLEARTLFVEHFKRALPAGEVVVLSPDVGGMKRAQAFRESLARATGRVVTVGFMEKQRAGGVVSGETLFAEVEGRHVVIVDDLISSGTTVARAAAACRAKGASTIQVAATHGVFADEAGEILGASALHQIVITDSVPPPRKVAEGLHGKLEIVETAVLFAEAIKRIHEGGSIAELLALP